MTPTDLFQHPLGAVYLHHLYALADSGVGLYEDVMAEVGQLPESGFVIYSKPRLLAKLDLMVTSAANISKLIHVPAHRSAGKSNKAFEWRRTRALALNEILDGLDLAEVRARDGRNAIEHFDQFLDRMCLEADLTLAGKHGAAAYNLAVTSAAAFRPEARPLRSFIIDTQVYHSVGEESNIGRLYVELTSICERIRPLIGEQPGGIMIMLPANP